MRGAAPNPALAAWQGCWAGNAPSIRCPQAWGHSRRVKGSLRRGQGRALDPPSTANSQQLEQPSTARRWRAKGGGSSHAFGRATECPSALGRWSALPGRLLPASCPVPRTGHRDMLLWRRRWPAQALNTAFEEGGSPRSARSSKRPAARPGGHGWRAQLLHGNCSNGIVKPWRCSPPPSGRRTGIAALPA